METEWQSIAIREIGLEGPKSMKLLSFGAIMSPGDLCKLDVTQLLLSYSDSSGNRLLCLAAPGDTIAHWNYSESKIKSMGIWHVIWLEEPTMNGGTPGRVNQSLTLQTKL